MVTKNRLDDWDATRVAAKFLTRYIGAPVAPNLMEEGLVKAGADAILKLLKENGQYWRHHKCWIVKIPEEVS